MNLLHLLLLYSPNLPSFIVQWVEDQKKLHQDENGKNRACQGMILLLDSSFGSVMDNFGARNSATTP